jgi:NADH dehydrogenase
MRDHRLVIVGGGVAGIELASSLARRRHPKGQFKKSLAVILVDSDSSHVWKPILHTIAAGTSDVSQQQTPYAAQAREAGFEYQPAELRGLDRGRKEVLVSELRSQDGRVLMPAREIPYDTLVIAIGSQANDFGTPGASEHCLRIDSRRQAEAFNQEVRIRMIQAVTLDRKLTIGIVGGGATGVELAAQLVQLTQAAAAYGAGRLRNRVTITLVESGPRLLPGFPENISEATHQRLQALGVQVRLSSRVAAADAEGVTLSDGGRIDVELKVWAAGVKGPDVLATLDGLEHTKTQQLCVKLSLQTTVDADIYAMGDCAGLTLPGEKRPLPPTAQVAHQQAMHLLRHLGKAIETGCAVPAFAYRDLGSLVSLGDYDAFGSLGKVGLFKGVTIRGRLAQGGQALLYREHQVRLRGFWRGVLLWIVDAINGRVKPRIRLD